MPSIYRLANEKFRLLFRSDGSGLSKTGSMRRPRPRNCQTPSGEVGETNPAPWKPRNNGRRRQGGGTILRSFDSSIPRKISFSPTFFFGRFLHSPMYFTPAAAGTRKVTQEVGVRRRFSDTAWPAWGVNQTMIIFATFHLIAC